MIIPIPKPSLTPKKSNADYPKRNLQISLIPLEKPVTRCSASDHIDTSAVQPHLTILPLVYSIVPEVKVS